jgi:hypothetical protein
VKQLTAASPGSWRSRTARQSAISGDSDLRAGRRGVLRAKLTEPGLAALWSLGTPYGRLEADSPLFGRLLHLLLLRGRYLSAPELAALVGWPIGSPDLPGLSLGAAKRLAPSRALPFVGRPLGSSDFPGVDRPVAVPTGASTRSLYVLGPTGTGKTSLLKNLIVADLEQGRGLLSIETNGDLTLDLIDSIPKHRIKDVVVIDPTDHDYAVGFNPFAGGADSSLMADQLSELFERLWAAFWGPRTAQLTHMGLLTLARRNGSTLLDLPRLYLDPRFREDVLAGVDDPPGLNLDWQWFAALSDREQATVVAPLLNKVRAFTARPSIRAIVGQPSPVLSMPRAIAQQKVVLVYLPKGLIGRETAQLLGCLILTALWQAFTARAALPPEQRQPFGLYVDEVQDLAEAPIPWDEMLAQGRKYGLGLTVAHQNLDQLPKALREVVLSNAQSKVAFTLSGSDARQLEPLFAPSLTAADLQALDPYSVAAIVALDSGGSAHPVTLRTPPPLPALGSRAAVRASSNRQFAHKRAAVEQALRAQTERRPRTAAPIGRKPRSSR